MKGLTRPPGSWSRYSDVLLVAAVVLSAVFWRMGTLLDERIWGDEGYVLVEAHGIHPLRPWPSEFTRSEVVREPSYLDVLRLLANNDVYPPLLPSLLFFVPQPFNPIAFPRGVFLLAGLTLLGLVYREAAAIKGPRVAVVAAAFVAFSPLLTVTSQQLKWYAIAPLLATAAAVSLLHATELGTRRAWAWYIVAITLLLHTHYFGVWAPLGHALFVMRWAAPNRQKFVRSAAVIAALCSPWYFFAFARQADFQRWYFDNLAVRPYDAWFQPLTLFTGLGAQAYSFLAAIGLQPSPIRVRYMFPLVVVALACAYKCITASDDNVRRVGVVAALTLACAMTGQTVHAIYLGNTIPLAANYYAPWAPLFMTAVILGAQEWRRPAVRRGVTALLVGLAFVNVAGHHYPEKIAQAGSLGDYGKIAAVISAQPPGTFIVFRRDGDAKVANLYYRGGLTQMIVKGDEAVLPSRASRVLFVSRVGDAPTQVPEGWGSPRIAARPTPYARLEISERTAPGSSDQP